MLQPVFGVTAGLMVLWPIIVCFRGYSRFKSSHYEIDFNVMIFAISVCAFGFQLKNWNVSMHS